MKKCTKCKVEKSLDEFYDYTRKRTLKSGKVSTSIYKTAMCKVCTRQYRKQFKKISMENFKRKMKNDPAYKEHVLRLQKERYWKNASRRLITSTKTRCKRRGIRFELTYTSIEIPEKCPILNVKFDRGRYAPTLDRIIPELGYIDSNVRVISKKANTMKNDASPQELKVFAENINTYMIEEIVQPALRGQR